MGAGVVGDGRRFVLAGTLGGDRVERDCQPNGFAVGEATPVQV
jgi:hypothetical protein